MNAVATAVIFPATVFVALGLLSHVVLSVRAPRPVPAAQTVGASVGGGRDGSSSAQSRPVVLAHDDTARWEWAGRVFVGLALALLTVALLARTAATGHAPFSNQYEFAVSFVWGVLAAFVLLERRIGAGPVALAVLPVAMALLLYARTVGSDPRPLQPALQHQGLLALHVAAAVVAYGASAVAFGAGVLSLLRSRLPRLPSAARLDSIGYRAVLVGFPVMTLMIVLGAVWAQLAWGRYWSWDPKETAALVTWLIYAAYLHARVVRDWRGRRAAALLILGFVAVLFTYFGNLFLGGLHAYA